MISDEGQMHAANSMRDAADTMKRAADSIEESVRQLTFLVGAGYGNPLEQLVEELKSKQGRKK